MTLQQSIPTLLNSTKEDKLDFANNLVNAIEEGEIDPLKAHLQIKSLDALLSILTDKNEKTNKAGAYIAKRYSSLVLEAAQKQGGKSFELNNAKWEIKEAGTKYDFSNCNDSELAELSFAAMEADKALKARQDYLKNIPLKGVETVDKDSGEMITIYPPSKTSTTIVSVTLK